MPAIGSPLRTWTLFLLLVCSIPTCAFAQAANETTTTATSGATGSSSITTPTVASSLTVARRYTHSGSTCPYRIINYITHTLPQQCAKTSWSAPDGTATAQPTVASPTGTALSENTESGDRASDAVLPGNTGAGTDASSSDAIDSSPGREASSAPASTDSEGELETDSPFDNANFLSFDEWKKRNLAQAGQSPENVGQGRAAPANQAGRRRPVNVNALDSLGDEGEIEIDFSGFGPPPEAGHSGDNAHASPQDVEASRIAGEDGKAAPTSWALSKDAGKTCKERFNYASFDCAATVLKTNKQAKSSTSVLVENKDSYMLNECSATNKFIIVELCDDILVDTVVLANYEFFSSMFRHFRVSVSDRYPVKMERWRTLGTFEARNTRDIQPFLVREPHIWARYIRIEFLTQFGNEFYCPLSLLRVHGTTMMEQFRREEEEARGIDDEDGELEADGRHVLKPAGDSGPIPPEKLPPQLIENEQNPATGEGSDSQDVSMQKLDKSLETPQERHTSFIPGTDADKSSTTDRKDLPHSTIGNDASSQSSAATTQVVSRNVTQYGSDNNVTGRIDHRVTSAAHGTNTATQIQASSSPSASVSEVSSQIGNNTKSNAAPLSPSSVTTKPLSSHAAIHSQSQSARGSAVQPAPPVPSTQESFYKSIHKRLLYLEANATLSLQYIEEQSRTLRDAFMKVEKRQLAKTEKFLNHLNSTVMQELKSYRNMYDQLWQSTIIELESMKERQNTEMGEIGARLSLMADELVWQKRMAVVQSTLLLLCLGLVLFVRSGTLNSPSNAPIVQQLGSKYNRFFESSPPHSPESSGIARRRRTLKNMWRSDTSAGLSDQPSDGHHMMSDGETDAIHRGSDNERSPPTPGTPVIDPPTPTLDDQAARIQVLETQSGPATPNGTRDSRPSWEEVDRAIDQLKAEEQGVLQQTSTRRDRDRKKKRSPLRRAHSSYDGTMDDSPSDDVDDDETDTGLA